MRTSFAWRPSVDDIAHTMTTVQKRNTSLDVRLPKQRVREFTLIPGSAVALRKGRDRISITPTPAHARATRTAQWTKFLIPTKKKRKEDVSGEIDALLYGRKGKQAQRLERNTALVVADVVERN